MKKAAFTLIELMVVIAVIAIIASLAMPMYADYTKKARTIEVPEMLKEIAKSQFVFFEDPFGGNTQRYATKIGTLHWSTMLKTYNNGIPITEDNHTYENADGTYWFFNAQNDQSCGAPDVVNKGFASAIPKDPATVPDGWQFGACMNTTKDLHHK